MTSKFKKPRPFLVFTTSPGFEKYDIWISLHSTGQSGSNAIQDVCLSDSG